MNETLVISSALSTIAYDPQDQALLIRFQDGRVYLYYGVPHDVADELLAAESKGKCFNSTIRGVFLSRLLS